MRGLPKVTHGKLLTIIYCNLLDAKKAGRRSRQRGRGIEGDRQRGKKGKAGEGSRVGKWVWRCC